MEKIQKLMNKKISKIWWDDWKRKKIHAPSRKKHVEVLRKNTRKYKKQNFEKAIKI